MSEKNSTPGAKADDAKESEKPKAESQEDQYSSVEEVV